MRIPSFGAVVRDLEASITVCEELAYHELNKRLEEESDPHVKAGDTFFSLMSMLCVKKAKGYLLTKDLSKRVKNAKLSIVTPAMLIVSGKSAWIEFESDPLEHTERKLLLGALGTTELEKEVLAHSKTVGVHVFDHESFNKHKPITGFPEFKSNVVCAHFVFRTEGLPYHGPVYSCSIKGIVGIRNDVVVITKDGCVRNTNEEELGFTLGFMAKLLAFISSKNVTWEKLGPSGRREEKVWAKKGWRPILIPHIHSPGGREVEGPDGPTGHYTYRHQVSEHFKIFHRCKNCRSINAGSRAFAREGCKKCSNNLEECNLEHRFCPSYQRGPADAKILERMQT